MTTFDDLRLIRLSEVLTLVPVSETTLFRMISRDEFPKPKKVSGTNVWAAGKIREWLESKSDDEDEEII